MLPLSANANFSTITKPQTVENPFADLNGRSCDEDLYGVDAINQAIEVIITTMPGECLFNAPLFSPLYEILFDNYIDGLEEQIFNKIELFVPIRVNRAAAEFNYKASDHTLQISIPWVSLEGNFSSVFRRHIGR